MIRGLGIYAERWVEMRHFLSRVMLRDTFMI